MAPAYDVTRIRDLQERVRETALHYEPPPARYDPGHVWTFDVTGVAPAATGRATLEAERFVGGGFAGQVYRAKLLDLDLDGAGIPGLTPGGLYGVKIIIPPSRFARAFRDAVYRIGYQAAFGAQVSEAAARAGALWQKLIRRGAKLRFGDEGSVSDIYATFFDEGLGSYGEIKEWVEGRQWKFEIDDRVFRRGGAPDGGTPPSAEYLAKKAFMAELVRLFHDMGAPELARQYEWWTCKSQPNVLKRHAAGDDPAAGLTAIDFRAGLVLLPFLPMSPVDIRLILTGLFRGALVQFDRGDPATLEAFCDAHPDAFEDLRPALDELKRVDPAYRASQPDLTRQGLRLLVNRPLQRSVKEGLIQGWRACRLVDEEHARRLSKSFFGFWLFLLVGFVPLVGRRCRKLWGVAAVARHVRALFGFDYLCRTLRASRLRCLIDWYREGRIGEERLAAYLERPLLHFRVRFITGAGSLPPKWDRFLTDWTFFRDLFKDAFAYMVRFYRDAAFRVQWLTGEVEGGAKEGMLTNEERDHILGRVGDPYIQKYLKCVAVHVCTLPVTQVISLIMAVWALFFLGKSWGESIAWAAGILLAFQATPISPGSIVRGTYVVYLMIKERNVRNYWIAVLVSFWHYVGYLGFPLQMVTEFPALSRFMAGRWATKMARIIPVFGEHGGLAEHFVFDFFFNVPLSIKRWFRRKENGRPKPS